MRTADEIQEQITKLEAIKIDIRTRYEENIIIQAALLKDRDHDRLMDAASVHADWAKQIKQIDEQLRVLFWVNGKFDNFPWH